MPQIRANGITLEYEIQGDVNGEPILLIAGAGSQLSRWPQEFRDKLADRGFRVIVYDHRDVGLSEKMETAGVPDIDAVMDAVRKGEAPPVAYTMADLVADAAALLDALGIERAHVAGGSMGGMIGQLLAADYPHKVLSLTSIRSSSGDPDLPQPAPELIAQFTSHGPDPHDDFEGYLAHAVKSERLLSPGYPETDAFLREQATIEFKRCFYPVGILRHYAAGRASPARSPKLRTITAPTLVIHGDSDVLLPVECAQSTAANIPGATLKIYPGMGHDLPRALFDDFVADIAAVAARAKATA
ncbi:MAG TPA: alpha/beta hydrolase [Caulobacteraceae bacterium]|nr:alpha/beta hydrolase [Caulobacteraceae bacterium]